MLKYREFQESRGKIMLTLIKIAFLFLGVFVASLDAMELCKVPQASTIAPANTTTYPHCISAKQSVSEVPAYLQSKSSHLSMVRELFAKNLIEAAHGYSLQVPAYATIPDTDILAFLNRIEYDLQKRWQSVLDAQEIVENKPTERFLGAAEKIAQEIELLSAIVGELYKLKEIIRGKGSMSDFYSPRFDLLDPARTSQFARLIGKTDEEAEKVEKKIALNFIDLLSYEMRKFLDDRPADAVIRVISEKHEDPKHLMIPYSEPSKTNRYACYCQTTCNCAASALRSSSTL